MGIAADLATANALLKEHYSDDTVQRMIYKESPLLALMEKKEDEDAGGKFIPVPIVIGTGAGESADFATAQANQSPGDDIAFAITLSDYYSLGTLTRKALMASRTNKNSFLQLQKVQVEKAIRRARIAASIQMYRSGTGSYGKISALSGTGSATITLTNPQDIIYFHKDMVLQAADGDGGTLRSGTVTIVAMDDDNGKFTVSTGGQNGSPSIQGTWQVGDYLLIQGNKNKVMKGLTGWIVPGTPGSARTISASDSHFGVNRSQNATKLAGVWYDGSGESVVEALIKASAKIAVQGGSTDYCTIPWDSWTAVQNHFTGKQTVEEIPGPAGLMFPSLKVTGQNGPFRVVPDKFCPAKTGFMLQMDTWTLHSLGRVPHIQDDSDTPDAPGGWQRTANADAYELRVSYYAQPSCNAPGWNGVVSLSQ